MKLVRPLLVIVLFLSFYSVTSQENDGYDYKVYLKEYRLKSISKEEFLKLDSITIEPKSYRDFRYTIIVTGSGKPLQFITRYGTKIDDKVKEWVKERDTSIVAIDEIMFFGKGGARIYPPIVISVK